MGSTTDAIRAYVEAAAGRGIDVATYVAQRADAASIATVLGPRSSGDLEEWFAFCGGVIPDSSTAYVFGGRPLLSAEQAATWVAPNELTEISPDADSLVPLFDDLPATFVDPVTGRVTEVDLVDGEQVLAASLGEWIDAQRQLLASVPLPGMIRFTPISFESSDEIPSKLARYRIGEVIDWFGDNSATAMTIAHAPLGSKDDSRNLELEQVEAVRTALVEGGVGLAAEALLVEDEQGSDGVHQVTISVS